MNATAHHKDIYGSVVILSLDIQLCANSEQNDTQHHQDRGIYKGCSKQKKGVERDVGGIADPCESKESPSPGDEIFGMHIVTIIIWPPRARMDWKP